MELEREVRDLHCSNDILRTASAFFARAELDRKLKSSTPTSTGFRRFMGLNPSAHIPISTFFLFDGALLHSTAIHARLPEDTATRFLYEEGGLQAAHIGPLLLPAHPDLSQLVSQLAQSNPGVAFAFSVLRGPSVRRKS